MVLFFFSQIWWFYCHIMQYQCRICYIFVTWKFFCHIELFAYFFLTFDSFILILCSSNITCNSSFLIFGGSLYFFLTFNGLSSHCVILTSHVTVLFSHLMVLLLFFLTFDGFIITLCSSNITFDSSFLTFGGSLFFFPHIWWFHYHIV